MNQRIHLKCLTNRRHPARLSVTLTVTLPAPILLVFPALEFSGCDGMTATMKDIAKKAKVSVITVSRAMNNRPDINSETKKRILKIARELNYTADQLARGLVTRKTRTIGVLVPDNVDSFYAAVVQGIGWIWICVQSQLHQNHTRNGALMKSGQRSLEIRSTD
jgi:transcriptional regulator with XRE-family HTH domain